MMALSISETRDCARARSPSAVCSIASSRVFLILASNSPSNTSSPTSTRNLSTMPSVGTGILIVDFAWTFPGTVISAGSAGARTSRPVGAALAGGGVRRIFTSPAITARHRTRPATRSHFPRIPPIIPSGPDRVRFDDATFARTAVATFPPDRQLDCRRRRTHAGRAAARAQPPRLAQRRTVRAGFRAGTDHTRDESPGVLRRGRLVCAGSRRSSGRGPHGHHTVERVGGLADPGVRGGRSTALAGRRRQRSNRRRGGTDGGNSPPVGADADVRTELAYAPAAGLRSIRIARVGSFADRNARRRGRRGMFLEARVNVLMLYLLLLKATLTSFSGLASLPVLRADLVVKYKVLTDHQLATAIAAGRMGPGPVGNYVVSVGYQIAGLPGAIAGWLAMITPAFLVIPIIRFFGTRAEHPRAKSAVRAVVLATCGLLLSSTIPLGRDALTGVLPVILATTSFLLTLFT